MSLRSLRRFPPSALCVRLCVQPNPSFWCAGLSPPAPRPKNTTLSINPPSPPSPSPPAHPSTRPPTIARRVHHPPFTPFASPSPCAVHFCEFPDSAIHVDTLAVAAAHPPTPLDRQLAWLCALLGHGALFFISSSDRPTSTSASISRRACIATHLAPPQLRLVRVATRMVQNGSLSSN